MDSVAVVVTYLVSGQPWQQRLLELGYIPDPTPDQARLFTLLTFVGLAGIAALGLAWMGYLLRSTERRRVH
jgi:hypothetical protein